jgi:hypothetical protein
MTPTPIDENTPRDKRIMLFIPAGKNSLGRWVFGRWNEDPFNKKPRPYWEWESYNCNVTAMRASQPTHWRPTPLAPGEKRQR